MHAFGAWGSAESTWFHQSRRPSGAPASGGSAHKPRNRHDFCDFHVSPAHKPRPPIPQLTQCWLWAKRLSIGQHLTVVLRDPLAVQAIHLDMGQSFHPKDVLRRGARVHWVSSGAVRCLRSMIDREAWVAGSMSRAGDVRICWTEIDAYGSRLVRSGRGLPEHRSREHRERRPLVWHPAASTVQLESATLADVPMCFEPAPPEVTGIVARWGGCAETGALPGRRLPPGRDSLPIRTAESPDDSA